MCPCTYTIFICTSICAYSNLEFVSYIEPYNVYLQYIEPYNVPTVYRNLCPTKTLKNETFHLSCYDFILLCTVQCSLSNPFSIIVNNASSMFVEMYHRFQSEAIVLKITTRLDSSLRIISSRSRKVTVENQFILSEKFHDS